MGGYDICPGCGGRKRAHGKLCRSCRWPRYGTHRTEIANGYIGIWNPERKNYELEHRLIMEAHLCRELATDEHVHHVNGHKQDNRLENLELLPESEHHRQHIAEAGVIVNQFGVHSLRYERPCEACGTMFKPWTQRGRFCSRVCSNQRFVQAQLRLFA